MKTLLLTTITAIALSVLANVAADGQRSYGDAWYDLETKYPSPERRYSRKELDQARRRANNSLWMDTYGRKDPIYQSNQYRGRSSGYRYNTRPMYRHNLYRPGF